MLAPSWVRMCETSVRLIQNLKYVSFSERDSLKKKTWESKRALLFIKVHVFGIEHLFQHKRITSSGLFHFRINP